MGLLSFSVLVGQAGSRPDSEAFIIAAALFFLLPIASAAAAIARTTCPERTLIVGISPLAGKLLEEIAARPDGQYLAIAIVDDRRDYLEVRFRHLHVGPLARLGEIIEALQPDRIVVALTDRRGRLPMEALLDARVKGVAIEDAVDLYERLTGKLAIEALTPSNLISCRDFRKSHLSQAFGYAVSLIAAVVGLIVLAPLFGLIALAIKLDSPGPVFFVQDRAGLGSRRFRLIKFRTMRPAERITSQWVDDNGDRITRVGEKLRRYRLDELPQLINVLRGHMNLIGPRPHPVSNFELFLAKIPYYSLRSVVRPGVTGWAQVKQGYAGSLEEETEKMRYDLYYVKHMSIWFDLRILLRTVRTVLRGRESLTTGRSAAQIQSPAAETTSFIDRATATRALNLECKPVPVSGLMLTPLLAQDRRVNGDRRVGPHHRTVLMPLLAQDRRDGRDRRQAWNPQP